MYFASLSIITNPFLVGLSEGRPSEYHVYKENIWTWYSYLKFYFCYLFSKNILYKDCDHHTERNTDSSNTFVPANKRNFFYFNFFGLPSSTCNFIPEDLELFLDIKHQPLRPEGFRG